MAIQQFHREDYLKLPEKPGIYKFFDQHGTIIYIGKAKSIKKRVSSDTDTARILRRCDFFSFINFLSNVYALTQQSTN